MNKIQFNRKYLVVGYGFDDQKPYILLDVVSENVNERLKFYIQNQTFSLIRLKTRFCIGRYELETLSSIRCPENNLLTEKNNTCLRCFKAIGFNPAFYNVPVESLSSQQRTYNEQPHNVYLAYFGPGTVKVGISHHKRTLIRWCEQGARAAAIIEHCNNAYEARSIEKAIECDLKMPSTLSNQIKRKFINKPFDFSKAVIEINKICNLIVGDLNIEITQPEIIDLSKYYSGDSRIDSYITDVSNDLPLYISGKGIGMIGDILIVEQSNRQFMMSLKQYISHVVYISNEIKKHDVKPIQMSILENY